MQNKFNKMLKVAIDSQDSQIQAKGLINDSVLTNVKSNIEKNTTDDEARAQKFEKDLAKLIADSNSLKEKTKQGFTRMKEEIMELHTKDAKLEGKIKEVYKRGPAESTLGNKDDDALSRQDSIKTAKQAGLDFELIEEKLGALLEKIDAKISNLKKEIDDVVKASEQNKLEILQSKKKTEQLEEA